MAAVPFVGFIIELALVYKWASKVVPQAPNGLSPLEESQWYLEYGMRRSAVKALTKGLGKEPGRKDLAAAIAAIESDGPLDDGIADVLKNLPKRRF